MKRVFKYLTNIVVKKWMTIIFFGDPIQNNQGLTTHVSTAGKQHQTPHFLLSASRVFAW